MSREIESQTPDGAAKQQKSSIKSKTNPTFNGQSSGVQQNLPNQPVYHQQPIFSGPQPVFLTRNQFFMVINQFSIVRNQLYGPNHLIK